MAAVPPNTTSASSPVFKPWKLWTEIVSDSFPVYVAPDGKWFVGDALRSRTTYIPRENTLKTLEGVTLDLWPTVEGRGRLLPVKAGGFFSKPKLIEFGVALLAFHGLFGEDGRVQGLFELGKCALHRHENLGVERLMDKAATNVFLPNRNCTAAAIDGCSGLPTRSSTVNGIGGGGALRELAFPSIVKPLHLGSSIGVARASTLKRYEALFCDLPAGHPCHCRALRGQSGRIQRSGSKRKKEVQTSAIERPKSDCELLDFKAKYLAGGGGSKSGSKQPGTISQGMLSLTRELNPSLASDLEDKNRQWATVCFTTVYGTGAPRIDFLCNGKTGEVWLNELIPALAHLGTSFGEASHDPLLFSELLNRTDRRGPCGAPADSVAARSYAA